MLLVSACADHKPVSLDSEGHLNDIDKTITTLTSSQQAEKPMSLSLQDAIDKALADNLDSRVAALETLITQDAITLEQLAMLPNITGSATYTKRSDEAASSSESIITGTQSLEPSTSSDPQRQLADLEAQWNLTDTVITSLGADNAKERHTIAKERLRTIRHNIERDVTSAYWNALITQNTLDSLEGLNTKASELQKNINKAQNLGLLGKGQGSRKSLSLAESAETLNRLKETMLSAEIELKSLTSIAQNQPIILTSTPQNTLLPDNYSHMPVNQLIKTAFVNRPEMREQYANTNIAIRNKRQEALRTFPGLNLIYGHNYDSNGFLVNESWNNFSAALTQSLNAILTYPTRSQSAETKIVMEEARKTALAAAIIAQIYLNKTRIEMAQRQYEIATQRYNAKQNQLAMVTKQSELGAVSGFQANIDAMDTIEAKINRDQAFGNLQRANMDMAYSLGVLDHKQYAGVP